MKKFRWIAIALLVVATAAPVTTTAKPAYCDKALISCQRQCDGFFVSYWCKGGCAIGYLGCGGWW